MGPNQEQVSWDFQEHRRADMVGLSIRVTFDRSNKQRRAVQYRSWAAWVLTLLWRHAPSLQQLESWQQLQEWIQGCA